MKNICLNWTISIMTSLFVLFIITTSGFIFGLSINFSYFLISLITFMFLIAYFRIKDNKSGALRSILAQYIIFFDILILIGLLCYYIPDISYDGNTYHQAMIILLKYGLNPVRDNVSVFANNQEYVFASSIEYVETFLKFFEIIGANIYYVFNKIELSKITNYILLLCAFCYSFYTLKNYQISNFKSILFSFLLIYNPVCICQMLSNYVDGAFYYVFLILLFACINYLKREDEVKSLFLICISAVVLSNIKLTGLFTTVIVAFVFLIIYRSKHLLASFIIALLLIMLSGINPYYTNINQGRNMFYPVIKNSVFDANKDGMITSYPKGFENKNRISKLLFSIFAVSNNLSPLINSKDEPTLKFPFTIKGDGKFIYEDMRLAGFGYFFSGILLCSLLLSLFIRFKNKEDKRVFWSIIAVLLISVLGNHEAWWARFVPQMWMIPILIILFVNMNRTFQNKAVIVSYILSAICIVNSFIINVQYFHNTCKSAVEFSNFLNDGNEIIYLSKEDIRKNPKYETFPAKMKDYGVKVIYTD